MSDDLISRAVAIDAFYIQSDDDGWWAGTVEDFKEFINGLPSAQRKKGKWIDKEGMYICSECGRPTEDRHDVPCEFDGHKGLALVLPFYCGFCGAEMEGEEDEREKVHRVLA